MGRVAIRFQLTKRPTCEQRQAIAHLVGHVDVKAPLRHRLHHALVQHQVAAVAGWHQHPLLAIQAQQFTASEITLDLFVDAAHRQ